MTKNERRKKVSMKDIAQEIGISVNAVSLALNDRVGVSEDTKALVIKTASALGYFDENSHFLHKNPIKNICLLIESRFFTDIPFYSKVVYGIEKEAKKCGFDLIVNFINTKELEIPSSIVNRKVAGILIIGIISDIYIKEIAQYKIPMVLVDHYSHTISTDAILTQNISGAYTATQYVMDKGHKKIGFFGDIDFSASFKERWLGYYECIRESDINREKLLDEVYKYSIISSIESLIIKNDYEKLASIVSTLKELPTAFVCTNDSSAICLIHALNILGVKVPEDISVIGFDDIDLCEIIIPNLTTIRINKKLMGEKAVKRLMWRMSNISESHEKICMEVALIERDSVTLLNQTKC